MNKRKRMLYALAALLLLIVFTSAQSETILLPKRLDTIETEAFYGDTSIEKVVVMDGTTRIEERAFSCSSLIEIELPGSITYIANNAFENCNDVTATVKKGSYAEAYAKEHNMRYEIKAESPFVVDENGVLTDYNGLPSGYLSIPEKVNGIDVVAIGENMFWYCDTLTGIGIPSGVTRIEINAFLGCANLQSVDIPSDSKLTCIDWSAFSDCDHLTDVYIPAGVNNIGSTAFSGCDSMTNITVDENNATYCDLDGVLFSKDQKTIFRYPNGRLGTYSIPADVTCIEWGAFEDCDGLTGIVFPSSLTSIKSGAFEYCDSLTNVDIPASVTDIAREAFKCCAKLTHIRVNENNTNYCDVDGVLLTKDGKTLLQYPRGRRNAYSIPFGVTRIENNAFWNCFPFLRVGVTISSSVTSIGKSAFENCYSLISVIVSADSNLTDIEDYAFRNCNELESVYLPASVIQIGENAFNGCGKLTITCEAGSYAESFAKQHNIRYLTSK